MNRFPSAARAKGRGTLAGLVFVFGMVGDEPASAGGIGGSFSYNRSSAELDDVDDVWADLDTETDSVGFGVIFDSNLAQDRLFNYRLDVSLELVNQEVGQVGIDNQVQGSSLSFDQTFGFGFIRTPAVRVFVGPSLHLGIGGIDDHARFQGNRFNYEQTTFTAGLGPELGINYHVGRRLTFSTSAFVRYGLQVQGFDDLFDDAGSDGVFLGDEIRAGLVTSNFIRFGKDAR